MKDNNRTVVPRESLDLWVDFQYDLEMRCEKNIHTDDKMAIALLGKAVFSINKFNSALLFALQTFSADPFVEKASQYFLYHNNLFLSKIKHFFFRENPCKKLNNEFFTPQLYVYELANELIRQVHGLGEPLGKEREKLFSRTLAKYCVHLQLLYDFIYKKHSREGVFLEFTFDRVNAIEVIKIIQSIVKDIATDERIIRCKLSHLLPTVLDYYVNQDTSSFSLIDRYERFVGNYLLLPRGSRGVEPLTWRVCAMLWHLDAIIQDLQDYSLSRGGGYLRKMSHLENVYAQINKFVRDYCAEIDVFYRADVIDYSCIFDLEYNFIVSVRRPPLSRISTQGKYNKSCVYSSFSSLPGREDTLRITKNLNFIIANYYKGTPRDV